MADSEGVPRRPTSICDDRGQTALELPRQRLLQRQGEPGDRTCSAYPDGAPSLLGGALGQDSGMGGWAGPPRPPLWGAREGPAAHLGGPAAGPSIPGSFENSPLPEGTPCGLWGRTRLWGSLQSC